MRSEVRTAIIFGGVVAAGLGAAGVMFASLDSPQPVPALTDNVSDLLGVDKSGFKKAPDIVGIAHYINAAPEELRSKIGSSVVLYDIWTYSCINCIRTLPYITAWDEKYADQGLLIVGIHSPEFEFEKDVRNVQMAVAKHDIRYPVVMDNDRETWNAFENRYWPRKFMADHEGFIRYDRIGEGGYRETERVIQRLLAERAASLGVQVASAAPLVDIEEFQHTAFRTPELYFGYYFAQNRNSLGSSEGFRPGQTVTYAEPTTLNQDRFYMVGTWNNGRDAMALAGDEGSIMLRYNAKEVNIVTAGSGTIQVLIDGHQIDPSVAGRDVDPGTGMLAADEPRLYNVVNAESSSTHDMEMRVENHGGFEIFTFTFG